MIQESSTRQSRLIEEFIIYAPTIIAVSLTASFISPLLDIRVAPLRAVRQGEPISLDVTLTYRGDRPIYVDIHSYRHPCVYSVPKLWKTIRRTEPTFGISIGFSKAWLQPGDQIQYSLDINRDYTVITTPGKYSIDVQGFLAVVSGQDITSGWLQSTSVKVLIQILAPEAKR